MLLASWQICQWKWFSFLNYADTVVVVFSRRKVQLLISHNAHLQRVVCSNISHALWWLHHLLWNKISLLWPLTGVFAEEEREADWMSCLRLCLLSVAELGSELKTCSCPALHIHLLYRLLPKCDTDKKVLMQTILYKHFMRSTHYTPSSKMLLKQFV